MHSPYGRGPCGACEYEEFSIYRIDGTKRQEIFHVNSNLGNVQTWWPEAWGIKRHIMPDYNTVKWDKEKLAFQLKVYDENDGGTYDMKFGFDPEWKPVMLSMEKVID
jgi:hypothetical protein